MGKPNWWVLGPFTVVMLVIAVVALTYNGSDGTQPVSPLEARHRCEDFADAQLKSPGSADYDLTAVEADGGWVVTGTVDSENSFGGSVRSVVRCKLHYDGTTALLDSISVT